MCLWNVIVFLSGILPVHWKCQIDSHVIYIIHIFAITMEIYSTERNNPNETTDTCKLFPLLSLKCWTHWNSAKEHVLCPAFDKRKTDNNTFAWKQMTERPELDGLHPKTMIINGTESAREKENQILHYWIKIQRNIYHTEHRGASNRWNKVYYSPGTIAGIFFHLFPVRSR